MFNLIMSHMVAAMNAAGRVRGAVQGHAICHVLVDVMALLVTNNENTDIL